MLYEVITLAAFGPDGDRAAEGDDAANAFRRVVRHVQRERPAQAPADDADLAAMPVVQEAHLV